MALGDIGRTFRVFPRNVMHIKSFATMFSEETLNAV